LTSALDIAEPEAARRVFIDEREPLQELLGELVNHKPPVPYANEVLQSMNAEIGPPPPRLGTAEGLPEPLSAREMEVLRLLETHLSSTEIAAQLIIAASTVRSHIKNIYSKLSVHSRAEAVEKAREIGLL
jgi:LuxR family maltose regulon positive regulatory protein